MKNKSTFVIAHPDDEIITCGGTLIRYVQENNNVNVILVCTHNNNKEFSDKRMSCFVNIMHELNIEYELLNQEAYNINYNDVVNKLSRMLLDCNKIITHHHSDMNTDHRVVSEAVLDAAPEISTIIMMNSYHNLTPELIKNGLKICIPREVEEIKMKYISWYDDINKDVCRQRYSKNYVRYKDEKNATAFHGNINEDYAELYELYRNVE